MPAQSASRSSWLRMYHRFPALRRLLVAFGFPRSIANSLEWVCNRFHPSSTVSGSSAHPVPMAKLKRAPDGRYAPGIFAPVLEQARVFGEVIPLNTGAIRRRSQIPTAGTCETAATFSPAKALGKNSGSRRKISSPPNPDNATLIPRSRRSFCNEISVHAIRRRLIHRFRMVDISSRKSFSVTQLTSGRNAKARRRGQASPEGLVIAAVPAKLGKTQSHS